MKTITISTQSHKILKGVKAELHALKEPHTLSDAIMELDARANTKYEKDLKEVKGKIIKIKT